MVRSSNINGSPIKTFSIKKDRWNGSKIIPNGEYIICIYDPQPFIVVLIFIQIHLNFSFQLQTYPGLQVNVELLYFNWVYISLNGSIYSLNEK